MSKEEGIAMAQKHKAGIFYETSAKEGTNIDLLFENIGRKIKDRLIASGSKIDKKMEKSDTKARSKTTVSE